MLRNKSLLLRASYATLLLTFPAARAYAEHPAQDAKAAVEEPQYINQFQEIGPDGKLIPLESQKMTIETKSKNHFISNSVSSAMALPTPASPVRVAPTTHFVIKAPPGYDSIDPNTVVSLKPFVVAGGKRTLPMHEAKGVIFGGVKSESAADTSVSLTFKKYGASSYEISPSQPLPPGEYALGGPGLGMAVFCFGVDAR